MENARRSAIRAGGRLQRQGRLALREDASHGREKFSARYRQAPRGRVANTRVGGMGHAIRDLAPRSDVQLDRDPGVTGRF